MERTVDITKYIIRFGIIYTAGVVLLSLVLGLLEIEGGSGASIAILIVAAMQTAAKFIIDNKRLPSSDEKFKLIWFSFLLSALVSLVLFLVILVAVAGMEGIAELPQLLAELNIFVIVIPIIVVSILHIALLYFSYGSLAKKQFVALEKKSKI